MDFHFISIQQIEKMALDKATRVDVLKKAVLYAQYTQPIAGLINKGRGFDAFAYQDALVYLSRILSQNHYISGLDLDITKLLGFTSVLENRFSSTNEIYQQGGVDQVVAYNSHLLMNLSLNADTFKNARQMLGNHNFSSLSALIKNKTVDLIVPFEYQATINPAYLPTIDYIIKQLGLCSGDMPSHVNNKTTRVSASSMYALEPDNRVFTHTLVPAPVACMVLDQDIEHIYAFVSHPKFLYNMLESQYGDLATNEHFQAVFGKHISKDDLQQGLSYDTSLALKILKHRYGIPISDGQIERTHQNDVKMYETFKEHGHVFLTY